MKRNILITAILIAAGLLISCASSPSNSSSRSSNSSSSFKDWTKKENPTTSTKKVNSKTCSRNLTDQGIKSFESLADFFVNENPDIGRTYIRKFAKMYVEEASAEGINSDCAFVQMCLETGFLRFGGLVTPEMHNYCGLGAIDEAHKGVIYKTEREGIRAHIQHLHAYATTSDKVLKNELIDPRYKYVNPRGKAKTIQGLSGTWAADPMYAIKLDNLLGRLEEF